MDVIGDIYRNSARLSERNMRKDKMYMKAKNQVKQCYQRLCENLSENELATLNKLIKQRERMFIALKRDLIWVLLLRLKH